MNNICTFEHPEFGSIRTIEINGEPWLVGKDVAAVLGYRNTRDALAKRVDEEDKMDGVAICDSIGREQKPVLINESGLYSLVLSSKLSGAKRFRRWVTSEVLPSIRKHGGYIAGQEHLTDEELLSKALFVAQNKIAERDKLIDEQQRQIETMRPKEIFADAVTASKATILVGELAKILKQNGVDIGQNRLFEWLRQNGYLIRRQGTDYNMPTQRSMNRGLFQIKETAINHSDGHTTISKTPKVTGRGQQYFINKFIGGECQVSAVLTAEGIKEIH